MSNQKLPFFKTILRTLYAIKERYRLLIKFSTPVIIVQLINIYISHQYSANHERFLFLLLFIVYFVFSSIVLVSFHRIFILSLKEIEQMEVIRFKSRELLFIAWFLIILIIGKVISFLMIIPFLGLLIHGDESVSNIIIFLTLLPALYFMSRMILNLPAISIDNDQASFKYAWSLSKGNGIRLVTLIFALPIIMILYYDSSSFVSSIISSIFTFVVVTIAVGATTISYDILQNNLNSKS